MLKRRLCEARFEWRLRCEGPLLIADGRLDGLKKKKEESDGGNNRNDPKSLDKVFISRTPLDRLKPLVETARSGEALRGLDFYVPGTSLRGPLRAQAERILRTVIPGEPARSACDPFDESKEKDAALRSCSARLNTTAAEIPYAAVCPACRLFGCTSTASRLQVPDADFDRSSPPTSVFRDMIGIDRFTGGVYSGANMRFHALEGSAFSTTITVTNFELWQLGLLAFALRDFEEGRVAIGFGKTKGFGQVRGEVSKLRLSYPKGRGERRIQHLQSLATEAERAAYKLHQAAVPDLVLPEPAGSALDWFESYEVTDLKSFWEAVAPEFTGFIQSQAAGAVA